MVTRLALAVERSNGVEARGLNVTQMSVLDLYIIGGVRVFVILVFNAFVDICMKKRDKHHNTRLALLFS